MPELYFGSHFFQDIVESGIFYSAIFDNKPDVVFRPACILNIDNLPGEFLPHHKRWESVIHLARTNGLTLYSVIVSQKVLCGFV